MEQCTKYDHEKLEQRVTVLETEFGKRTESLTMAWKHINHNEEEIKEVKEFHKHFIRLESNLENVDKKVDHQIEQSQKNTEAIIKALVESTQKNNEAVLNAVSTAIKEISNQSKKTIEERFLDVLIPSIFYGAIAAFVYFGIFV